ncbi:baseplate J/gp47 family protein [Rhodovulum sp. DZ06]|uniref:baseplate J/gp47 family protein n=1 Tax=Rhodovulum sp. DZ06 TaxID=3425126 RepID=UPI003D331F71
MSCGCEGGAGGACGCGAGAPMQAVADPARFAHGAILGRLVEGIGAARVGGAAPLRGLTTRDPSDPAMALLDAYALGLHVIGWNADRLWRDGTIGQGEDRDALAALAALLGHAPRPAISAETVVAFTVDETPGAPEAATAPLGMKLSTVPEQGGMPAVFETSAPLEARRTLNALRPVRQAEAPAVTAGTGTLTLAGLAPGLREGDSIAAWAAGEGKWLLAAVLGVERPAPAPLQGGAPGETAPATTVLTLAPGRLVEGAGPGADQAGAVRVFGRRATGFGATAPDIMLMTDEVRDAKGEEKTLILGGPEKGPIAQPTPILGGDGAGPAEGEVALKTVWEWAGFVLSDGGTTDGGAVDLDAEYEAAAKSRAVLFSAGDVDAMGLIDGVSARARSDFAMAARVTRIEATGVDLSAAGFGDKLRETSILLETATEQVFAPLTDPEITGDRITVQGVHEGLLQGRLFVLTGQEWAGAPGAEGPVAAEVATLLRAEPGDGVTTLVFAAPLSRGWRTEGLAALGNCVAATEGETGLLGAEQIGVTDAADPLPVMRLPDGRLAHVPGPGPRGYVPAVELRVGGRLYTHAERLRGLTSADRAFRAAPPPPGDDAAAAIAFPGPLPGGAQPVTALWRKGGGAAGNAGAGALSTILSPVLGLRAATNPIPATGGQEPEGPEEIRAAAPAAVRVLDRVVSARDYETFAAGYRGVGKAMASVLRAGMREVMCLTVADTDMAPPVPGGTLATGLEEAIRAVSPPGRALRIAGFAPLAAEIRLGFAHDPALERAAVEAALRAALLSAFSPAARPFGRALHRSEILAAAQGVPGVVAARLAGFALPGGAAEDHGRLLCPAPRMEGGVFVEGGLLHLSDAGLTFEEMTP